MYLFLTVRYIKLGGFGKSKRSTYHSKQHEAHLITISILLKQGEQLLRHSIVGSCILLLIWQWPILGLTQLTIRTALDTMWILIPHLLY